MAPPGPHKCDFGESVSKNECAAACKVFMINPHTTLNMQVGSGGQGCLDGGWGQVPLGCSLQQSGMPHYKTSGNSVKGCIGNSYQLVCRFEGLYLNS